MTTRRDTFCERCETWLGSRETVTGTISTIAPCGGCMRLAREDGHRTGWNDAVKFYGLNREEGP